MCLLIQQTKETNFSDEFLSGVYSRNSDGIGFMWAEDNKLNYYKALPATAKECIEIYREYAQGKDCCVHFRMKTHGNIDLTNCHPYPVFGFKDEEEDAEMPILLMHNGVLSTGNSADLTKSDTWHYIRNFIRPLLKADPEVMHTEAFQKIVASHIGSSNKFAMMDATGRTVILNRQAGVEYEGAWLSNTYAWDYYGLHPNAPKYHSRGGYGKSYGFWDEYDFNTSTKSLGHKPTENATKSTAKDPLNVNKALTRKEKKAVIKELNSRTQTLQPLKDVVDDYMRQLSEEFPDTAGKVSRHDLNTMFFQIGRFDAEDFITLFMSGEVTEPQFLEGIKEPLTASRLVNQAYADSNKLAVGLS